MFDNDQMTETPELRALRDSFTGVEMPRKPSVEAIKARARSRRRYRLPRAAALLTAGVAAGAILALVLVGTLGRESNHGTAANPKPVSAPRTIRTASYVLVSDTTGKVTLTIDPRKLFNPSGLQADLARYGIPARVTADRFCSSDPEPAGLSKVVSTTLGHGGTPPTITFDASAIPAGAELSFGRFQLNGFQLADVALIDNNDHTCSTTPPSTGVGHMQLGYMLVPPGKATSRG